MTIVLLAVLAIAGDEIPAEYVPILDKVYAAQTARIDRLEKQIKQAEASLTKFDPGVPTANRPAIGKQRREKIATMKKDLAELQKWEHIDLPPVDLSKSGDVGAPPVAHATVETVDKAGVTLGFTYDLQDYYSIDGGAITKDTMASHTIVKHGTFCLVGPHEAGIRRGDDFELPTAVRVSRVGQPSEVEPADWLKASDYLKQYLAMKSSAKK